MSSLQEKLEQAASVAHISSKHVGLTIALIGVLIAFCAAMVGSEQNELTRSMMEQTQANSDYSGASTKFCNSVTSSFSMGSLVLANCGRKFKVCHRPSR